MRENSSLCTTLMMWNCRTMHHIISTSPGTALAAPSHAPACIRTPVFLAALSRAMVGAGLLEDDALRAVKDHSLTAVRQKLLPGG